MLTATVDIPLGGSRCFAGTIASVISFDDGRSFQATGSRDGWSQMILDLLQLAATSVFNRRSSGFRQGKRWNGSEAFEFLLNSGRADREMERQDRTSTPDGDDVIGGVSVICIDLGDPE